MLEEHQSCNDILVKMAAVKVAINQAIIKLLEGHMESCVSGSGCAPPGTWGWSGSRGPGAGPVEVLN